MQECLASPFSFFFCYFLRWLYSNHLTRLPAELGHLSSLKKLWLDKNQVRRGGMGVEGGGKLSNLQVSQSVPIWPYEGTWICGHRRGPSW